MDKSENKGGRPSKNGENPFTAVFRELVGNSTQQEVADKIGVSRQNVGKWLSGATTPDINTLCKISNAYRVSTDYLLGRTEVKTAEIETRAACELTGLSVEAMNNITILNKLHKRTDLTTNAVTVSEIINEFVGSDCFEHLVFVMHYYVLTYIDKTAEIEKNAAEWKNSEKNREDNNSFDYLHDLRDYQDKEDEINDEIGFVKWKAVQTFESILDNMAINNSIKKRGENNGSNNPQKE